MAKVEIRRSSWLNFSSLLEFEGQQGSSVSGSVDPVETIAFWDNPEFPKVVPQEDDIFILIDDQIIGRLDLVAFELYGDSDLWWVLALANNFELLPTDMVLNTTMRVPSKAYVYSLIGKGQQK